MCRGKKPSKNEKKITILFKDGQTEKCNGESINWSKLRCKNIYRNQIRIKKPTICASMEKMSVTKTFASFCHASAGIYSA